MQHNDKTTLCESENGRISVFNNAVAYEFRFKKIVLILTGEKIHALKTQLENLEESEWFSTTEEKFILFNFAPLSGNFFLSESEVEELHQLLLEATAMIKVYRKLFFKITPRIN